MFLKSAIAFSLVLLSNVWAGDSSHGWSYPKEGVEQWGNQCEGQKQSPVDILDYQLDFFTTKSLSLHGYNKITRLLISNVGHTVQFTIDPRDNIYISGANLKGKYVLKQIHFHWKSEHTLNGVRFPLEAHLVHVLEEYKDRKISELTEKNSIVVLGVFYYENKNSNVFLDRLFGTIKSVSQVGATAKLDITPRYLLPVDLRIFYEYEGSLTTPGCNEIVQWIIFESKIPISSNQYRIIKNMEMHDASNSFNFRSLQKHNNRTILHVHTRSTSTHSTPVFQLITFNIVLLNKFFI